MEKANEPTIDTLSALAGILALLSADRDERASRDPEVRKAEAVLADAGLTVAQIARTLGRNYDAVRMSISRGRAGQTAKLPPGRGRP